MKFKFIIEGLDCPNCAAKLASIFEKKEGIETANINFLTERLTVESTLERDKLLLLLSSEAKSFDKNVKIK